jgi:hypothetical protein
MVELPGAPNDGLQAPIAPGARPKLLQVVLDAVFESSPFTALDEAAKSAGFTVGGCASSPTYPNPSGRSQHR